MTIQFVYFIFRGSTYKFIEGKPAERYYGYVPLPPALYSHYRFGGSFVTGEDRLYDMSSKFML